MTMRSTMLLCAASAMALAGAARGAEDPGATNVEGVVVTAPRQAESARQVQFAAPNIVNVQSAETIAKYPDFNAAEALGRMPGISLSSDTGEGRFVEIRGLDGNLNGATYGGVVLLNTNPGGTYFSGGGRAVEFDTIPTGAIDGIVLIKTGLPDHDAEGLGGSIELTPRTAVNVTKPFLDATLGWGYEAAHDHTGPFNAEFALGSRFGFDNGHWVSPADAKGGSAPFSFVITGSRRDDRRGFDDLEGDYIDDATITSASGPAFTARQLDKAMADLQLRRYDYHRRRFGYGGEFDYQPSDDHAYYLRASVAGYTEQVTKNRLTYDSLDQALGVDPANPATTFVAKSDLSIKGTDEQETHRNQVFAVGGRDRFGDLAVDYRAAYSRATFNVGYNIGTTFKGPTVGVTFNNITDADFPQVHITDGTDPNNAALYKFSKLTNSTDRDVDEEWSYAVNATLPVDWLSEADRVKAGFNVRLREKTAHHFTQAFTLPKGLLLSALSGPAITDFYDGHYTNGPQIDRHRIEALAAGAGGVVAGASTEDPSAFFDAEENIYAGYGQYTTEHGPWGLLAGVRVERTEATYKNNVFNADGDLIGPERRNADYTDYFPTVQLRYTIRPDMVARATYSTGIGRPGFNQIAQPTTIDSDNNVITTGNPNLKPTTGDNFDLTFEYYLAGGGILQLGAFDKEFDNYIVATERKGPDPRLPGVVTFVTFGNISSAYARGLEAAYNQRFAWLPQPFDGLGVEANITAVQSRAEVRPGENITLPGTSKLTYNLAAFYEAHGLQLRLAGEFVGKTLFGIGGDRSTDVFEDERATLDFTSSYKVSEAWTVYFNAKNLTNEPLRFYERASDRPIQREFYDVTYEAGVRAKF